MRLVLHGRGDRSTSFSQAQDLFAVARDPKELWPIDGAGHVDLHAFAPAEYERRVLVFLEENLR